MELEMIDYSFTDPRIEPGDILTPCDMFPILLDFKPSDWNYWKRGWTDKNKNLIKKLKSFNHDKLRINNKAPGIRSERTGNT